MNRSLPILVLLSVAAPLIFAGTPSPEQQSTAPSEALLKEITELKEKYRNTTMPNDSPDWAVFKRIWVAAQTSEALVQELIDLTTIRLSPPGTTERITAFSESPAAGPLFSLGDIAKPHIEARLAGNELTSLQREILGEVLLRWERRVETKRIDAAFYKALRAEEALQVEKEAAANIANNPEEPNPNGKLVWTMLVAAGALALALAWLGFRCRGLSRRTVGNSAGA